MLSSRTLSLAVLLAATGAYAQSTTATAPAGVPSLTPCVLTCITTAGQQNGCADFSDLSCVCTNSAFQQAAQQCLTSTCTADEQAAALQLQQTQCAAYSATASGVSSASSVAESASSVASSVGASITSAASSAANSASSAGSSIASSLSSRVSSATSAAGSSTQSPSAAQRVSLMGSASWGVALAALGAVAGGAMMF